MSGDYRPVVLAAEAAPEAMLAGKRACRRHGRVLNEILLWPNVKHPRRFWAQLIYRCRCVGAGGEWEEQ